MWNFLNIFLIMNQIILQAKREELEKKLNRMEEVHSKKFLLIVSEDAYRSSCMQIYEVYKELFNICLELGDPIPVRF